MSKIAKNLALVLQMVGTDACGLFINDLTIENFGVSKNNKTVAVDDSLFPFRETKDVFEIDHDALDKTKGYLVHGVCHREGHLGSGHFYSR